MRITKRKIIFLIGGLVFCVIVVWAFFIYKSDKSIGQFKNDDWQVREKAMQSLTDMGKLATGQLIKALQDEDADIRWRAAKILGDIGDKNAVYPLITALKDEDKRVKYRAIEALSNIGDKAVVEFIDASLKEEKDLDMQMKMMLAVQTIKEEDFVNWQRQQFIERNEWAVQKSLRRQFKTELEQQRQKLLLNPDWLKARESEKRADLMNLLQENEQKLLNERENCLKLQQWLEENKDKMTSQELSKKQRGLERYNQTLIELSEWIEQHRTKFIIWQ